MVGRLAGRRNGRSARISTNLSAILADRNNRREVLRCYFILRSVIAPLSRKASAAAV